MLKNYKLKKIKLSLIITIIIFTIYCILCTDSRNAVIGIIIATLLMIKTKLLIIVLLVLDFYLLTLGLSSIPFFSSLNIQGFYPNQFLQKFFRQITLINYSFQEQIYGEKLLN